MGKSRTSSVNAMSETGKSPKQLVVVGGGMVARRLVDALRERDGEGRWAVTLLAEEPRAPYDRVALTSYFTGRDPDDLALGSQEIWHDRLVSLKRGVKVTAVDREKRTVTTADGSRLPYDASCWPRVHTPLCPRSRATTCAAPSSTAPSMMSPTCARSWRAAATTSTAPCAEPSSAADCSA